MRLVLDSNVLIAAFVARGVCAELLEHAVRVHEPVTSAFILEEVHRGLLDKVRVSASQADSAVKLLRTRFEIVEPAAVEEGACRDPDDLPVLGTALAARGDALVTGDKDLLELETWQGIRIVSPPDFWRLESRSQDDA
jgi:putative PIN family toxin of toxin-antitoxin system